MGISACLKDNGRGGWVHSVGERYVQAAIRAVGALPILVPAVGPEFDDEPAMTAALDRLLDSLDGVLLSGSPSNVEWSSSSSVLQHSRSPPSLPCFTPAIVSPLSSPSRTGRKAVHAARWCRRP